MRVEYSEPLADWIFRMQGTQRGYHGAKSCGSFPELQQSIPGIVVFLYLRAKYLLQ